VEKIERDRRRHGQIYRLKEMSTDRNRWSRTAEIRGDMDRFSG
jgi:hypothetical protein